MATKPISFTEDEHKTMHIALALALATFERRASDPKTPVSVRSLWDAERTKIKDVAAKLGVI